MSKERLYIDFHVIQTVPPSCVNRDDTGRPKTAVYGGVTRARVSSQSWKHAMRVMFSDIFSKGELGYRTKYAVNLVAEAFEKITGIKGDDAEKKAIEALENAGIKIKEKKKKKNESGEGEKAKYTTDVLFFISSIQAENLAELIANKEKDKNKYKEALQSSPSMDIALFGRMFADDKNLNVDASSQVAHSISTHAVQNEYDYFTAVDDCSAEDNAGAGHLGTMEFNSATLYRYATINVSDLRGIIGENTADAVRGFAEAFIRSMPTGKQNSYANRTLPDMVYVTVREDQPVNLCGAFEKPVISRKGYVEKSISAFFEYAEKIYDNYCEKPVRSYVIGSNLAPDAEKVKLTQLLDMLHQYIAGEVV